MTIEYDVTDGVAAVVINRPEKRNAMNREMRGAFADAIERAGADPAVRAVLVSATGNHFCAGADLGEFGAETLPASRQRMRENGHRMVRALWSLEKPVVAAVQGSAIGLGWAIALACDQIVAARSVRFAMTFTRVGLVPDTGSAYFLVRQIGLLRAKQLMFGAKQIGGDTALDWGLISTLVDDDALANEARAAAVALAEGPTFAFALTKQLLHRASEPALDDVLALEMLISPQIRFTDDYREGTTAFRERRPPNFKGS
jgi:2-(1,2-epoxy-1,2-dihydrophenyl)acetyl-CoA isomerase